jgi:hypothetical protein
LSADGHAWRRTGPTADDLLPAPGPPRAGGVLRRGSGELVVVGATAEADGVDAAAWTSADGGAWTPAPHDEGVLGGDGGQVMTAAVEVGGRIVAVGTEAAEEGDGLDAAVWSSTDGARWQRAEPRELRAAGRQHVEDVTVLGGTAVAVGWERAGGAEDAVLWVVGAAERDEDPAGAPVPSWVRVEGEEALAAPGEQRMEAVIATAEGFVAVGSARPPAGAPPADGPSREVGPVPVGGREMAAWTSRDGWSWARATGPGEGGAGDGGARAVAAGEGGVLAVGSEGGEAAAWRSDDGARWARVALGSSRAGAVSSATAVTAVGGGFVAVGHDDRGGAVWASPDGTRWARVDGAGLEGATTELHGVVVSGERVVAVGSRGEEALAWESGDLRTWAATALGSGRATAASSQDGSLVAVGSAPGAAGRDAVVWRRHGDGWDRVEGGDLAGPDDGELLDVVLHDVLSLAVGWTSERGGDDAASWTSTDAATWARTLHDEAVLGGDQAQRMESVVVRGTTAVAVGWSGSTPEARDAVVWVADQVDVVGAERNR